MISTFDSSTQKDFISIPRVDGKLTLLNLLSHFTLTLTYFFAAKDERYALSVSIPTSRMVVHRT